MGGGTGERGGAQGGEREEEGGKVEARVVNCSILLLRLVLPCDLPSPQTRLPTSLPLLAR